MPHLRLLRADYYSWFFARHVSNTIAYCSVWSQHGHVVVTTLFSRRCETT